MKKYIILCVLPTLFLLSGAETVEAQIAPRRAARVEAGKPTVNVQRARTRRRVRRRTRRRINRRTVNSLPAGTVAIRYKRVNYYPINGYYHVKEDGVYVSVLPPVGFKTAKIPWTYTIHKVRGKTYFYANGMFYTKAKKEYEIAEPPVGVKVAVLPEDAKEITLDNQKRYIFSDTVYKKSSDGYELVGFIDE